MATTMQPQAPATRWARAPFYFNTAAHMLRIGRQRAFNLNELLIEYHLLRRVVIEEIAAELKRPLTVVEDVGLQSGIDIALRQAAAQTPIAHPRAAL